jgi:hypothetical protein
MSDKRSVSTDALETLGTIIDERAGRDAIHVAVEPCKAGEKLYPGQDIGVEDGIAYASRAAGNCFGIVDPFLKNPVLPGEHFWMLLYPRTITSLRHVWSHPAFEDKEPVAPDKAASEAWLREFCATADCPGYEDILAAVLAGGEYTAADDYFTITIDNEYFFVRGSDAHGDIPPEFWTHMEIVTGTKILTKPRHFTCSC